MIVRDKECDKVGDCQSIDLSMRVDTTVPLREATSTSQGG